MKNTFLFLLLFAASLFGAQQNPDTVSKEWEKDAFYKLGKEKLDKDFKRAITYTVTENYVINGVSLLLLFILMRMAWLKS